VLELSQTQARHLQLAAQGLLLAPSGPPPPESAALPGRMQLLQIDTIHVVARSPYVVLFPAWAATLCNG